MRIKMLKRDRVFFLGILGNLERAQKYLLDENTLVCMKKYMKTTTLDYQNDAGDTCVSITKEYGSELALLWTAIEKLQRALKDEEEEERS